MARKRVPRKDAPAQEGRAPAGARPPVLFMGEQEDPELANLLARGDTYVYGVNRGQYVEPPEVPIEEPPRESSPVPSSPPTRAVYWNTCADCLHGHTRQGRCFFTPNL